MHVCTASRMRQGQNIQAAHIANSFSFLKKIFVDVGRWVRAGREPDVVFTFTINIVTTTFPYLILIIVVFSVHPYCLLESAAAENFPNFAVI